VDAGGARRYTAGAVDRAVAAILERKRLEYLRGLERSLRAARAGGYTTESEVLTPCPANETCLHGLMRQDLRLTRDGKSVVDVVRDERSPKDHVAGETASGMAYAIEDFRWHDAHVGFMAATLKGWTPLEVWARTWLDPEDRRPSVDGPEPEGAGAKPDPTVSFRDAVDRVEVPKEVGRTLYALTVDFGSARVDAFRQFLEALESMGVRMVMIRAAMSERVPPPLIYTKDIRKQIHDTP
jgi:hypothetical protein